MKNLHKKNDHMSFRISFLMALFVLLISNPANAMTHPGGWHTQTDLTLIRTNIAAEEEPWISAWLDLKDSGPDTDYTPVVSRTITNQSAIQSQGHAAYVLAIKWVASGDQAYATAAINIINAWVNTVTKFDFKQSPLRQAIGSNKMANAAEILAWGFNGSAGWSAAEIKKAQTWFERVIFDQHTGSGRDRSLNFGTSCVAGNMSMAIFCDDKSMFKDACDAYKRGFRDTDDGCCGVKQYIINSDGQCYESGRDQTHTQGGIAHLVEAAMIAWNQGVDLVRYSNYRIVAGMEYTAKYNLGNDVSWTSNIPNPCNVYQNWTDEISPDGRGRFSPIYVMAATLFERAEQPHPYTAEVVTSTSYSQPESHNDDHPGLGTLTFAVGQTFEGHPIYKLNEIPCTIEAENYDFLIMNSEEPSYHDTTKGNRNGAYRTDDVDITALSKGGFALTQMEKGEWLTYTVSIPEAGNYDVAVRYAAREEGAIKLGFKGGASTDSIILPVTKGTSSSWVTYVVGRNMRLKEGIQRMHVMVSEGKEAYALDHISIQPTATNMPLVSP